ncbi:hypothetical protein BOTBODRAFT_37501 [Botryobasidium botryosum FD-172 SS1]|uniref:Methylated-DNA--protein-cysteine methyltransferase n=1 Tax=Botryobasidium botryosum (strain FD-172 SS1) TaxID=930990 RepID=A0A067M0B5_BOTB1|nr:hypothetical protein BOTBODRAFT_37501 [Botryobasidium botryosum FD-172 SS1]
MPALRTARKHFVDATTSQLKNARAKRMANQENLVPCRQVEQPDRAVDLAVCGIYYPLANTLERQTYQTKAGKHLSNFAWSVYDFVRAIPVGKVTTYKVICDSLGQGSPRSVGTALRTNPFAPFVPCHRIIASNHFIGGFRGEWGMESKTKTEVNDKMSMLAKEGIGFTKEGFLIGGEKMIWKGP